MSAARSSRRGLSLVELLIVLALLGVFVVKLGLVVDQVAVSSREQTRVMLTEDRMRQVLDRIALAIMGADRQMLNPLNTAFPLHTDRLQYRVSMGVENGVVVWSDAEQIGTDASGTQVQWVARPGELDEQLVVWTNAVRPLLEGEFGNGGDDNLNGLIDEEGLNFVVGDNSVTVRLTMRGTGDDGESVLRTVETKVVPRNRPNQQ